LTRAVARRWQVSLKAMKALLTGDAIAPPVIVSERMVHGSAVLEL
jgi:hypothetical protein